MAISHVFSNAVTDWTGTVTVHNSQGSTATVAASNIARPVDWNSVHNQFSTLSGNTSNASTASGTDVVLQGLGDVTLVGSTGTLGISVAPGTATMWWPFAEGGVQSTIAFQQGSLSLWGCPTPTMAEGGNVEIDRVVLPVRISNATNSTGSVTLSQWFGLYTKNASTLSLAYSTSQSNTWAFAGTNSSSLFNLVRLITLPWTTSIPAGSYYVANLKRSTSGGADLSIGLVIMSERLTAGFSGAFGAASNRSNQWNLGHGVYSATTNALPNSIGFSQIDGTNSLAVYPVWWALINGSA